MPLTEIKSENAPKAIGPYSQSIKAGNYLFLSGQVGIDPNTGNLIGEDITTQTQQVISNIKEVLKSAGIGLNKVIKTTIFLKDIKDFKTVNEIYASHFISDPKPARETVEVSKLPGPENVKIEMSCIAYLEE